MLDGDRDGDRCRAGAAVEAAGGAPLPDDEAAWLAGHCWRLSLYTVQITAGANHSGFAVRPFVRRGGDDDPVKFVNFGAEGLYDTPKWDLSRARYRPLHAASAGELRELERQHTRAVAGVYFWLTNCCHHSTARQLRRMGYRLRPGAHRTAWFDETLVQDP